MKRSLFLLIVILLFVAQLTNAQSDRPKIGLVLSGGGARGFAHIGVLKMIDSLQIPIDYVVGTSMGGIVGALYSIGYSGAEIEEFVIGSNWSELFSDKPDRSEVSYLMKKYDGSYAVELGIRGFTPVVPSGLIGGQNVLSKFYELTSSVESIRDFDQFQTPFRCVAIDLITGQQVVLSEGSLAKAMRSTMAIPTVFSPVEWGDSLLIDGGILNNFPTDVAMSMGADIIIGVNVGTPLLRREELKSLVGVLSQVLVLTDFAKLQENMQYCDLLISPELGEHATGDFDNESVNEILQIGMETAKHSFTELVDFRKDYVIPYQVKEVLNIPEEAMIEGVIITGADSYPLEYFYEALECRPFQKLNLSELNKKISTLKKSSLFTDVKLNIIPLNKGSVNIHIDLVELSKPIIYGIEIEGNKELSFDFIYNLLNLKPGEVYDEKLLRERVTDLFSLGYFEHIGHTICSVRDNYVQLVLDVTEKSRRTLRVGYRYDDEYKLVGLLSVHTANVPFAGLRSDFLFQFAGLFKIDYEINYPTRTLNTPLYPYLRFSYKDIPVNIFDPLTGKVLAEYDDNTLLVGAGLKLNLGNIGEIKFEYNHEYANIKPNFSGLDPVNFQSWKDDLRVLRGEIAIDLLDDAILPRKGLKANAFYDYTSQRIASDAHYHLFAAEAEYYYSMGSSNTIILSGKLSSFFRNLPPYKYQFSGGPNSFVGLEINQLYAESYGYLRFDYRYEFKKDIFLKLIFNAGCFAITDDFNAMHYTRPIYGAGLGVKFLSIIGPIEIIFSRGPKAMLKWDNLENNFYFTAGFLF